jgi:hypothetical protein
MEEETERGREAGDWSSGRSGEKLEAIEATQIEAARLTAIKAKPIGAIAEKSIATKRIEAKPIAVIHVQRLRLRFPFRGTVSDPSTWRFSPEKGIRFVMT